MSTKKFDYRVRIQVAADSSDGILLDCLKNERHQSYSHKEMLLWALRAYWMPIAYQLQQEQGKRSLSDAQMKRMAQDAINQLRQQIAYLQSTFAIEPPSEDAITPHSIQQILSLLTACRTVATGSLNSPVPQAAELVIDSDSLSPESTRINTPFTQSSKDPWYHSEELFDSEI